MTREPSNEQKVPKVPRWRLIPNAWEQVKRLWSIRVIVLLGLLQGLYAAWPVFQSFIPPVWFAVGSMLLSVAALIARLIKQKDIEV